MTMTDTETIARLIAPDSWRVMDDGLASLLRKHKGENIGYNPENFQHKPSMAKAQEIIDAIKSLGWLSPADRNAILDEAIQAACNSDRWNRQMQNVCDAIKALKRPDMERKPNE